MLFCLICTDKPNALELRLATRDAHLKYWSEAGCLKIAGPFTNDDQSVMNGSMLVIDVADRATAEKLLADDPYNKAGLFAETEIRPWKWMLGAKE